MFINKQDYESLYESLSKRFSLYNFVDGNYIIELLDSLAQTGRFDLIDITNDSKRNEMNPLFYINFKIQNYLYLKICLLSLDDIDILLALVEDKRRVVELIFRKLKIEDKSKLDDYIMNAAALYNGSDSFDSFLTRYVMAMIRGTPFDVERTTKASEVKVVEDDNKQKKKKKKKKNKGQVVTQEVVKPLVGDAPLECNDSHLAEQNLSENDFNRQEVIPPQKIDEPGQVDARLSHYEKVLEKCRDSKGTGNKDSFVEMVLLSNLLDKVYESDNDLYKIYFLLRYGLMNESFYTINEIALLLEKEIDEVIGYERITIKNLKEYLTRTFNLYEEIVLKL